MSHSARLTPRLLAALLAAPAVATASGVDFSVLEPVGSGTPGTAGVPRLVPLGKPATGQPMFALRIEDGRPNALAQLVLGVPGRPTPLAAYGAVLQPAAPWSRYVLPLDASGASAPFGGGPGPTSAALDGLELVAQGLVLDPRAQGGAAFTAGLRLRFGEGSGASALFESTVFSEYEAGFHQSPAIGDLDGNGLPDLAAATGNYGQPFSVFYRQTDGGYVRQHHVGDGLSTIDLDVGDLDGDGRQDVVLLASTGGGLISAAFGEPDGTLAAQVTLATVPDGFGATWLALADMDGDAQLDAVTFRSFGGSLAVYPGLGGGALGVPRLQFVAPTKPESSPLLLDLDLDGLLDAAVLQGNPSGSVAVLTGLGGGSLASPVATQVDPGDLFGLAATDLDADGLTDLLVTTRGGPFAESPASLQWLRNLGSGLAAPAMLHEDTDPLTLYETLHVGDLDEDGQDEVYVKVLTSVFDWGAPGIHYKTEIFQAEGASGPAWTPTDWSVGTGDFAQLQDVDGDGHLDMLETTWDSLVFAFTRGLGNGQFATLFYEPALAGNLMAITDFDEDGRADVAVWIPAGEGTPGELHVGFGTAEATLALAQTLPLPGDVAGLVAADFDSDGHADLVLTVSGETQQMLLLRGFGDGRFGTPEPIAEQAAFGRLAVADTDGDGHLDVVGASGAFGSASVIVVRGLGGGAFAAPELNQLAAPGIGLGVDTGDVNGDGLDDLAFAGQDSRLSIAFAQPGGSYGPVTIVVPQTGSPSGMAPQLGDLDGDGDLDGLCTPNFDTCRVALNDGTGAFTLLPVFTHVGDFSPRLADLDADGRLDLLSFGIALGLGDGSFAPPVLGGADGEAADVDGDGDLDTISFGTVSENRLR